MDRFCDLLEIIWPWRTLNCKSQDCNFSPYCIFFSCFLCILFFPNRQSGFHWLLPNNDFSQSFRDKVFCVNFNSSHPYQNAHLTMWKLFVFSIRWENLWKQTQCLCIGLCIIYDRYLLNKHKETKCLSSLLLSVSSLPPLSFLQT